MFFVPQHLLQVWFGVQGPEMFSNCSTVWHESFKCFSCWFVVFVYLSSSQSMLLINVSLSETFVFFYTFDFHLRGDCSSVGRAGGLVIGRSLVWIPAPLGWNWATCWSILEQDTEPQNAPDAQLAPVWQPLPSARVLQWAGDSFRVGIKHLRMCQFGFLFFLLLTN